MMTTTNLTNSNYLDMDDDDKEQLPPRVFNSYLMQVIFAYWAAKGYCVKLRLERMAGDGKNPVWTIKSDMKNGKPLPESKRSEPVHVRRIVSPPLTPTKQR